MRRWHPMISVIANLAISCTSAAQDFLSIEQWERWKLYSITSAQEFKAAYIQGRYEWSKFQDPGWVRNLTDGFIVDFFGFFEDVTANEMASADFSLAEMMRKGVIWEETMRSHIPPSKNLTFRAEMTEADFTLPHKKISASSYPKKPAAEWLDIFFSIPMEISEQETSYAAGDVTTTLLTSDATGISREDEGLLDWLVNKSDLDVAVEPEDCMVNLIIDDNEPNISKFSKFCNLFRSQRESIGTKQIAEVPEVKPDIIVEYDPEKPHRIIHLLLHSYESILEDRYAIADSCKWLKDRTIEMHKDMAWQESDESVDGRIARINNGLSKARDTLGGSTEIYEPLFKSLEAMAVHVQQIQSYEKYEEQRGGDEL